MGVGLFFHLGVLFFYIYTIYVYWNVSIAKVSTHSVIFYIVITYCTRSLRGLFLIGNSHYCICSLVVLYSLYLRCCVSSLIKFLFTVCNIFYSCSILYIIYIYQTKYIPCCVGVFDTSCVMCISAKEKRSQTTVPSVIYYLNAICSRNSKQEIKHETHLYISY